MNKREKIFNKFNGKCAYSGTDLESDWQIDHLIPKRHNGSNDIENLIPCQKLINHYKRALSLRDFRALWLGGLHKRLEKLPKNPRTEKSKRHKEYMLKIADYFDIRIDKPFSGKFYFEEIS